MEIGGGKHASVEGGSGKGRRFFLSHSRSSPLSFVSIALAFFLLPFDLDASLSLNDSLPSRTP
jgi:hypothetical protein